MYPLAELRKRAEAREERKEKLKELLEEERQTHPDEYKIDKSVPLGSKRVDVARKIISRMSTGDSVLVMTPQMAQMMCKEILKIDKIGSYKEEKDGYRVWLF